jgi:hypothetical protein
MFVKLQTEGIPPGVNVGRFTLIPQTAADRLHGVQKGIMGRRKPTVNFDVFFSAKLCPVCKGSGGEKKECYESTNEARQRADYIKKERGILLNVYRCPHGNGWHLTKNNADYQEAGEIPRASSYGSKVSWGLVIEDKYSENDENERKTSVKVKKTDIKPIIKVESNISRKNILLTGKVVEIVKNISIEKIFNINLESPISANLAKDFLDDQYQQITVFVENSSVKHTNSYTVLVKKTAITQNKIVKDSNVRIVISGNRVNSRNVWHCDNITKI